jgi:hypothetical protein
MPDGIIMRRIDILIDKETGKLVQETESYRSEIEALINKEFTGRIMFRKFVKYARLLGMDEVELSSEDGKIVIKIFSIPYIPESSYGRFRVKKVLTLQARKWRKLHKRMIREAEPYLVAEAI